MLETKSSQQEHGFTLTEVLVAILITSVFVATAMQAVVVAAVMRVKAKRSAEATTWIQQDLENVKSSAATLAEDPSKCNTYGTYLQNNLPSFDATKTISGKSFTLSRSPNPSNNILQLTYTVTPQDDTNSSVASIYTEIIPDAAFKCPS